jgi:hypothetical protein
MVFFYMRDQRDDSSWKISVHDVYAFFICDKHVYIDIEDVIIQNQQYVLVTNGGSYVSSWIMDAETSVNAMLAFRSGSNNNPCSWFYMRQSMCVE